jgi:hypothetical protein
MLNRGCAPQTEVCLTVDTEFSIGGAFGDPQRYRPLSSEPVDGLVDGCAEGLGFLLAALRDHGIAATFFVEVLQSFYFGDRPMGRVVERIAGDGHDVELHLHPGWLAFRSTEWRTATRDDCCASRTRAELRAMIEFGIAQFARWQAPAPQALRAGNFAFARPVHEAMVDCGLGLGSNIAISVYPPHDPEFDVPSGSFMVDGVLEVPAFTYLAPDPPRGSRMRTLAITASSWRETEALLWRARDAAISPIVVLTHPFEFVKRRDFRFSKIRRDRVNQQRLLRFLKFLSGHADDFSATTFARSGHTWIARGGSPGGLLQAPFYPAMARLAENAINTLVWRY